MPENSNPKEVLPVRIQNPFTLREVLALASEKRPLTPEEQDRTRKLNRFFQRSEPPISMSLFLPDGHQFKIASSSVVPFEVWSSHFSQSPDKEAYESFSRDMEAEALPKGLFFYQAKPLAAKFLDYLSRAAQGNEQEVKQNIKAYLLKESRKKGISRLFSEGFDEELGKQAFLFAVWCCLNQPPQTPPAIQS